MDLLSVTKVKRHGLSDVRWKTTDKMVQYKGLVKLYQRENKIVSSDKAVLEQNYTKEIRELNAMTKSKSEVRAVNSTKIKMDQMLIPHKGIRLICRNLSAEDIMEHVKQLVFSDKKRLDILRYGRDKKARQLAELKIYAGNLEDQINYKMKRDLTYDTKNSCERITGRIQDKNLHLEAAIMVRNFYIMIRDMLYRDSIYYTNLLFVLQSDRIAQNRCMCQAIILGQTAVEYLDDTKKEFHRLRKTVVKSRLKRNADMNEIETALKKIPKTIKSLADMTIITEDIDLKEREGTRDDLENCFIILKKEIMVSDYENILPCLKDQEILANKFRNLVTSFLQHKDYLNKRIEHAKVSLDVVSNSNYEETTLYLERKEQLEKDIAGLKEQIANDSNQHSLQINILTNIQASIDNIRMSCEIINSSENPAKFVPTGETYIDNLNFVRSQLNWMFSNLKEELRLLNKVNDEGYHEFSKVVQISEIEEELVIKDVDDISMEDGKILTSADIKEQSRQIVEFYKSVEFN